MFAVMKNDQERRAARIDEATRDWLESQVFPTIPLISEGGALRHSNGFVSPVREPVEMGSVFSTLPETLVAA